MSEGPVLHGRYVALDFETTGLKAGQDRIIDVGAVEWVDGAEGRRLSTLVDPGIPVPAHITRLTGISDADLLGAPSIETVLPELLEFLGDAPVLAHNASFEEAFLSELLGRRPHNRFLDTLELAAIVRAEDKRRSLDHLSRALGVRESEVHRGLEDALDCLRVTLELLGSVLREERRALLDHAVAIMAGTEWSWLPEVEHLRALLGPDPGDGSAPPKRARIARREEPDDYVPVEAADVQAAFSPDGPLGRAMTGWEPRPAQLRMAEAVAEAFSEGRSAMIEAPTGVGKSLAYLVPAALFAKRNGVKVMVATHTKNLQDQLADQELPRVAEAVGGESLSWCVVKGQENYLCKRRTERWLSEGPAITDGVEERSVRLYVAAFAERSHDGDLEGFLPWHSVQGPHVRHVVDQVRSTSATCLHQRCPHFDSCFYQDVVFGSRQADILVTNHALALSWPERYGRAEHLVLDEAHGLEDAATSAFTLELDPEDVRERLRDIGGDRNAGLLGAAGRVLDDARLVRAVAERVAKLSANLPDLTTALDELLSGGRRRDADYPRATLRITGELEAKERYHRVAHEAALVGGLIEDLVRDLASLLDALTEQDPMQPTARELVRHAETLDEGARVLMEAFGERRDDLVYWVDQENWRSGPRLRVRAAPISVGPVLEQELFAPHRSVVLTSATLTVGLESGDGYVAERLGFSRVPPECRADLLTLESPFDLPSQLVVGIPEDVADHGDGRAFVRDVSRIVVDAASRLGGRTLVLFTANRRRDAVARIVTPELEAQGIEVLTQGSGMGRDRIVRELRSGGRKVVLGSRSFWEGIDVKGDALSCVIIEKLPFDFPWDPVVQAREEAIRAEGGIPFDEYSLPKALLRFRQGVGRLIRSSTDRGVVLLLQSNLYRRSYLTRVEEALPGLRLLEGPWVNILEQLDDYVSAEW